MFSLYVFKDDQIGTKTFLRTDDGRVTLKDLIYALKWFELPIIQNCFYS